MELQEVEGAVEGGALVEDMVVLGMVRLFEMLRRFELEKRV